MATRFYCWSLLYALVFVIWACGIEQDQNAKTTYSCSLRGDGIPCNRNVYTEDLLTVHRMATIDALRDYLLEKKNLNKSSPFRKTNYSEEPKQVYDQKCKRYVTVAAGRGDINDLLRGIALAKNAYGINPLFALSLSALESKWGESCIAKSKYNLWGWNAADGRTGDASKFESFAQGFNQVFKDIKFWYLKPDGRYHKSCSPAEHFKRYVRRGGCSIKDCGASLAGMNCKYSSDPKWAFKIRSQMNHIARFINERCNRINFDFKLPRLELPRFPNRTDPLSFMMRARSSCIQ